MRTLYLHVGQSKTGSSYIQASLANSMDVLTEAGFDYPGTRSADETEWKISSGNGQQLIFNPASSHVIRRNKVLFSAEQLFRSLALETDSRERLAEFCEYHAITRIEGLMFLRDPLPHAESSYHQVVKRMGYSGAIEPIFAGQRILKLARDLLDMKVGDLPVHWHLWNYDKHRGEILAITERFLGIDEGSLQRGDAKQVNRSMTRAELALLRELNVYDPSFAGELSDALCNELPDIKSESMYPSHAVQQALLDKHKDNIDAINAAVPDGEEYSLDLHNPVDLSQPNSFSDQQMKVIARVIGERVQTPDIKVTVTKFRQHVRSGLRVARSKGLTLKARARRALGL